MLHIAKEKLYNDTSVAQDVVQDVFISISQRERYAMINELDEDNKRGYIIGILNKKVLDYYRTRQRRCSYIVSIESEENKIVCECQERNPIEQIFIKMELVDLLKCISMMSVVDRRIFEMLLFYEMKSSEIAQCCNLTAVAVRKRVARARVNLRERRLIWQN